MLGRRCRVVTAAALAVAFGLGLAAMPAAAQPRDATAPSDASAQPRDASAPPSDAGAQPRDGLALIEELGATDHAALSRAITAIENAPRQTPHLEEALFAAGRACEDTLADPARALALYDRILRDHATTATARAAEGRAAVLRPQVGTTASHAREAAELARLRADADRMSPAEVERRATELAGASWPGAPEAARFLAEWLQRTGRYAAAQRAYADIVARWPNTEHAVAALRSGADTAIRAGNWDLAEELTRRLPEATPADRVIRAELFAAAAQGRRRAFWYGASWIALAVIALALLASLADATLRGGRRRPVLRPPIEVVFLAPVAAVLVAVALTTHQLIAPAVVRLTICGIVLAWLSGMTLETLRARGRDVRTRAIVHAILAVAAVAAMLYIVLLTDNLLDMMIETVRFGPED